MNDGRPIEFHYINPGFSYTATESFMEFFDGPPVDYDHAGPIPYQEYWSMNMNPYKFGLSGPDSASYYGSYEEDNSFPRLEVDRGEWEYPLTTTIEEPTTTDSPSRRDEVNNGTQTIPEESSPNRHDSSTAPVMWQDHIDPDNMTYEELLDLGEAVGTQSRGLSQELIDLLPTSKYKFGSLFKRKNFGKRCVICQMTYRRGDQQMKLPCRHVYHGECITKWLSINKKCPVCNVEVFGDESTH
ncbi:hypothetical protein QN277_002203 [Acacia crassicarpa]|uniref:RING-type domain-containing protein n=1 Tax=Acacia crassicarpa TaxID=499986 RepID=A0AAE1THN3_9FABA|nr:hypothetical protein QN277_002203 [Acacia crassicarpa]